MGKEKVECNVCKELFRDRFNMWRHYMRKHFTEPSKPNKGKIEKNKPTCSLCGRVFYKNGNLKRHSKFCKKAKASNSDEHNFKNINEFEEWKRLIEIETKSRFVKKSTYKLQSGSYRTKYSCHRSGYFRPKGKNIRHLKHLGTNKINGICPAKIIAIVNPSGEVNVSFFPKHCEHSTELKRITLSKNERAEIATKLEQKVPFKEILQSYNASVVDPKSGRLQLLTRKDLYNIEKEFKINSSGSLPYEDIAVEGFPESHAVGGCSEAPPCVNVPIEVVPTLDMLKSELRADFENLLASLQDCQQALLAKNWLQSFQSFVHSASSSGQNPT